MSTNMYRKPISFANRELLESYQKAIGKGEAAVDPSWKEFFEGVSESVPTATTVAHPLALDVEYSCFVAPDVAAWIEANCSQAKMFSEEAKRTLARSLMQAAEFELCLLYTSDAADE